MVNELYHLKHIKWKYVFFLKNYWYDRTRIGILAWPIIVLSKGFFVFGIFLHFLIFWINAFFVFCVVLHFYIFCIFFTFFMYVCILVFLCLLLFWVTQKNLGHIFSVTHFFGHTFFWCHMKKCGITFFVTKISHFLGHKTILGHTFSVTWSHFINSSYSIPLVFITCIKAQIFYTNRP